MAASTEPGSELLRWHPADQVLPDAELTVLMWTRSTGAFDGQDWEAGWWDGEHWRLCESGGICAQVVTHWAEPAGPDVGANLRAACGPSS